jgi:hypothetical protein
VVRRLWRGKRGKAARHRAFRPRDSEVGPETDGYDSPHSRSSASTGLPRSAVGSPRGRRSCL